MRRFLGVVQPGLKTVQKVIVAGAGDTGWRVARDLERTVLDDIGITPQTAIVASTDDDENNIIACLLARKLGAAFGVALISKPDYVSIINEANLLDRAVSPYITTINAILRFVRGAAIRATTLLQNVPGELLEIRIPPGSAWSGRALRDARLPRRAVVAALVRGEDAAIATGDTVLREGDRLVVFAPRGAAARLEAVFRK
ncbi:MAG: NAD-binding protein [Lentisphaerae bacterium]|nr:NAD-binding protein [Lentisphaerota bacterium]